jgi:CRP/FNR family cyclic AMP-dependent transcriptional regulator
VSIRAPTLPQSEPFSKLLSVGKSVQYATRETVFSQGEKCSDVRYIENGLIELSICSTRGKRAVLGLLGRGDFFGVECLLQPFRHRSAAMALLPSSIITIKRRIMSGILAQDHSVSIHFTNYLLARKQRIEDDLIDRVLNSGEKRLARILLQLAQYISRNHGAPVLEGINQEMLADMVGTTRPRISFFMNKFRKLGLIQYNGGLIVHKSLTSVLRD